MTQIIMTLNTGGEKGEKGDKGDRGEGQRGPQGLRGPIGPQGLQGPQGHGLTIIGSVEGPGSLPTTGQQGDAYLIGTDLWVYAGVGFVNMGPVRGPIGPTGATGPEGQQGPPWINWRGIWQASTSYEAGDGTMAVDASTGVTRTLRAIADHTSGTTLNLNNWQVILQSQPGPTGPAGPEGPASTVPGPQGPQGIQGIPGPQGIQGSLYEAWVGLWSENTVYEQGKLVRAVWQNGSEIIHALLMAHTTHLSAANEFPSEATYGTYWTLIAQLRDGMDGRDGTDGLNVNTIVFTDETEFDAYMPGLNELVVLVDG